MTFKRRFASKKLLVGSLAALALTLSGGAFASVSAQSGQMANPPVVANQCEHPGYAHFGFSDKNACQNYVTAHARGHVGVGNGYGGGNQNNNHPSIIVSVGNIVNSAVNITINFVTNIFS